MNQCFLSLPNKRLSYWRLTGCGQNDSEMKWQLCHFCIFSQPLFIFSLSPLEILKYFS